MLEFLCLFSASFGDQDVSKYIFSLPKSPLSTSQQAGAALTGVVRTPLSHNPEGPNRLPNPVDSQMQADDMLFINPNGGPPAAWNPGDSAQSN
jgi:hypothetical protein